MTLVEIAGLVKGELIGGDAPVNGFSTDSRRLNPGELFIAIKGPAFDGHDFIDAARERDACGALVSRPMNVALPQIGVADTRLALGRLGAAWREGFSGVLIALTGSNGKTTVKEMIKAILARKGKVLATQGNLNNDIGMPLTLLRLNEAQRYAVIEMGANHAGEIAYLTALARPDVALINNAGPAHLEGFGDLDGVARAKGEIFRGLGPKGIAVINGDDAYADYWRGLVQDRHTIGFGLDREAEVRGQILSVVPNRFRLTVGERAVDIALPLPGRHNLHNALAAAATAYAVGASLDEIRDGLEKLSGVAGRLQALPGRFGTTVFDDTYNANPGSLNAALETVAMSSGRKWLILGDMKELGPGAMAQHEEAGRRAKALGFERLYGLGEYSRWAVSAFGEEGAYFESMDALVSMLSETEIVEGVVILVKGSRSMHMERVVRFLTEMRSAEREAH